jgi:hypothetical protein
MSVLRADREALAQTFPGRVRNILKIRWTVSTSDCDSFDLHFWISMLVDRSP